MVDKKAKLITFDNGVSYAINRYVDVPKEYDAVSGAKKKAILDQYSEAAQRNIMIDAILSIAASANITNEQITKLQDLKTVITNA